VTIDLSFTFHFCYWNSVQTVQYVAGTWLQNKHQKCFSNPYTSVHCTTIYIACTLYIIVSYQKYTSLEVLWISFFLFLSPLNIFTLRSPYKFSTKYLPSTMSRHLELISHFSFIWKLLELMSLETEKWFESHVYEICGVRGCWSWQLSFKSTEMVEVSNSGDFLEYSPAFYALSQDRNF